MKFQLFIGNRSLTYTSFQMTVPSFSSQILNFATSFTTVNLDTKNKVRTELLNIPLIFFISRFVFHGICSEFHSRVPLICIYSGYIRIWADYSKSLQWKL